MPASNDALQELIHIMARLRGPGGCPWDREQDHQTLLRYLVEEVYEFIDAVEEGGDDEICDELGDVLLQVVFHSQIASERDGFDIQQVARTCADKLIRRHPHVFGDSTVEDADGVITQWEAIKKQERGAQEQTSALAGIPKHLPALTRAETLQKKAAKVGFDWPDVAGVIAKLREEIVEFEEACQQANKAQQRDELGDILFSVVNLCRKAGESPDELLRQANRKFQDRFQHMERQLADDDQALVDCDLDTLEAAWQHAKEAKRAQ